MTGRIVRDNPKRRQYPIAYALLRAVPRTGPV